MFAAGRNGAGNSAQRGKLASNGDGSDDDDWLRVGRSFNGPTRLGSESQASAVGERALQVYKKPKKESRRRQQSDTDSDSDRESESGSRRSRKHGKERKKKSRKKESKKLKKRHRPKRRVSDSDASSSSRESSDSRYSRSRKRTRRADRDIERSRRGDQLASSRRRENENKSELLLVEAPSHEELEVYRDQIHGSVDMLFEYDCTGDRDNSFYGSIYVHEQPLYHLATRRSPDGAWIAHKSNRFAAHPRKSRERQAGEEGDDRYFGPVAKQMEKRTGAKRLHLAYSQRRLARLEPANVGGSQKDELSFIPLGAVVEGELDSVGSAADGPRPHEESDSLFWQTDLENVEKFLTKRQKELNERVNAKPHDVDGWLDFMAFQDEMARLSKKRQGETASDRATILEKQKAIWFKAIEKNPESRRLRQLQLNLLWHEQQLTASTPDSDSYRALVEQLLENDRSDAEMWMKLIRSSLQKFGTFSMTMLRDLYARAISVLNKELAEAINRNRKTSSHGNSSIHVIGIESLLGAVDPYMSDELDTQSLEQSKSFLAFHRSMVWAEISAGYTERAITQLRALIEFNGISSGDMRTGQQGTPHHKLLESFAVHWNDEAPRIGDENEDTELISGYLPPVASVRLLHKDCVENILQRLNPPLSIRSAAHTKDLLGISGSIVSDEDSSSDSADLDVSGRPSQTGGQWVYSNLHGKRILIADANESVQYEKILGELRGSESAQLRQEVQVRKQLSAAGKLKELRGRLRDERVDYADIDPDEDQFLHWLTQEVQADLSQWQPLRESNPLHIGLIEMQPDRAILTEEILPFVFRVPRCLHFQLVLNLLEVVGVHMSTKLNEDPPFADVHASDSLDCVRLLVRPILNALDSTSTSTIALSAGDRQELLSDAIERHTTVSPVAAVDETRIRFIRRILRSALVYFENDADLSRLFKVVSMEFECEVTVKSGDLENATKAFRLLCQDILKRSDSTGPEAIDMWLVSVYATVELRLGNDRLMTRVCDKTLASLTLADESGKARKCRSFHFVLFLRIRHNLQAHDDELGSLQAFFILWKMWHPEGTDTLDSIAKQHRKDKISLLQRLRTHMREHEEDVIQKYRLELQGALDQCTTRPILSSYRSCFQCAVPFALSNLCFAVYATHGLNAAEREFEHALNDAAIKKSCCHAQKCWYMLLGFLQGHQSSNRFPLLAPRDWRRHIALALVEFPLDPLLLRLFVDAEMGNTMSQSLRKHFTSRRQAWRRSLDSPEMLEWLFALLCEFARSERYATVARFDDTIDTKIQSTCCVLHKWEKNRPAVERVRQVFEEMVGQLKTSGVAIGWHLYLRFELAVGKVEKARRVFYRGLVNCPWSKALYLDGFRLLRPYLSRHECQEIIDFLGAKEIHIRVDTYE